MTVTVLMVPFVLVATMLVVQFGLAAYARHVAAGASQDGADTAAAFEADAGRGEAVARMLFDASAGQLTTSTRTASAASETTITVTVTADVVRVLPLFPAITISATGSANRERFVPEG